MYLNCVWRVCAALFFLQTFFLFFMRSTHAWSSPAQRWRINNPINILLLAASMIKQKAKRTPCSCMTTSYRFVRHKSTRIVLFVWLLFFHHHGRCSCVAPYLFIIEHYYTCSIPAWSGRNKIMKIFSSNIKTDKLCFVRFAVAVVFTFYLVCVLCST